MKRAFFLAQTIFMCVNAPAESINPRTLLNWELGYSKSADAVPEKWMPASVPGAVQLDIAKAENYEPYYTPSIGKITCGWKISFIPTELPSQNQN
jgi:hypothetical protein